jgi:anti-sigma B factor antagonist
MLPFHVERQSEDHTVRVIVHGEVDVATGPRLAEEVRAAESAEPERLVIDLREVTFFDSTGLQIILDAEVRARNAPWALVVAPGQGEPRRILELAEVLGRLQLEEP